MFIVNYIHVKGGERMTNTRLLREAIKNSGLKIGYIISKEQLNLSYQGFENKVNGDSEFTASEIMKISELLELSVEDRDYIFFKNNSELNSTKEVSYGTQRSPFK